MLSYDQYISAPLHLQDFEDKEYNIKREGKEYWQLGRLGPDMESEELQAKREKAERVKQMAAQVRDGDHCMLLP